MRLHPASWFACALVLASVGCGSGGGGSSSGGSGGTTPPPGGGTGGSSSPVPVYVLIGGSGNPGVADVYLDNGSARLGPGEVFIMAKDPLLASRTYRVSYAITAGGTAFSGTWQFTTGTAAVEAPATSTALAELNRLRGQAGAPAVSSHGNLAIAARRHAGYQAEKNTITHNEPDSAADFYIANGFSQRISIANGGTAGSNSWPGAGTNLIYETIATNGDAAAVSFLWDTVYHRIPMMRRHVTLIGNGDRSDAMTDTIYVSDPNGDGQPFTGAGASNQQFQTIEYCGVSSTAQVLSLWPADNASGIGTTFATDQEAPDPISAGNGNGTPNDNLVGTPIHLILPSTGAISAITVSLSVL